PHTTRYCFGNLKLSPNHRTEQIRKKIRKTKTKQMDAPAAIHFSCRAPISPPFPRPVTLLPSPLRPAFFLSRPPRMSAAAVEARMVENKPGICTADELHFVDAYNSDWKLALWRYLPSSSSATRKRPLLLLSGVATNAVGFDLCPESSFARAMSAEGFDTWVLELRGSGLSTLGSEIGQGFLYLTGNSTIGSQIRNLSQKLVDVVEGSQLFISPNFGGFEEVLSSTLEDAIEQLDLVAKCDWDFDHYLEEDLPSAMEYIRSQSKPNDGKLFAIGHSMGGILLYAMLARSGYRRRDSGLTSIATLGSSLDYTPSNSSLKLLLPVADPAKALNVPAIPIGKMVATAHQLSSNLPYLTSWLKSQISTHGMLDSQASAKLVSDGLCTVPAKLLLQLTTAFQEGGLRDRTGTFFYKKHLPKSNVPVLALAGDQDLICPPAAAYETAKFIPKHLVTYRVLGEPRGPHYGHFDLVGGRWACHDVYPRITDFFSRRDL
ncbi:hypothetical protein LINPERPRIM_LOCUS28471, partial [Linum perenne]